MKAVGFLDRLIRAPKSVPITEFASLVKEEHAPIPDSGKKAIAYKKLI